jgi:hypothetical protein
MRVVVFVRNAVVGGDCAVGPFFEPRFEDEVDEVFADIGEFGGKVFWHEDGSLGDPEFNGAGVSAVEVGEEIGIVLPGEGRVIGFPQGGDHEGAMF